MMHVSAWHGSLQEHPPYPYTPGGIARTKPGKIMVTFINKDSTSENVARSTPTERRLINEQSREHRGSAARTRARQRRRANETRLTSDQERSGESSARASTVSRTRRGRELNLAPPQPETPLTATDTTTERERTRIPAGDPRSNPGNPIDPFQTSSVQFNAAVIQLLRYYKEVYYDVIWTNITTALDGKFDAATIPRCQPETVVLECMENRTRMYCLLADTGCYMKETTTVDLEISQLQLLQRGTESLREEMASQNPNVDTDIMIDAMHLYLAAMRTNREDATKAHMAGVKAILREILRLGVPVAAPNVALLALVDVDLSHRILSGMDLKALAGPKTRIILPVSSYEETEAPPPEQGRDTEVSRSGDPDPPPDQASTE